MFPFFVVNFLLHSFRLPYDGIFGGVTSLTESQLKKVNGYSNDFWGWGGEDDDMHTRCKFKNFHLKEFYFGKFIINQF